VQARLEAWLRNLTTQTPHGELLPLLLDDPFSRLHGEGKWEVLEVIDRLAEQAQMIYLTDDTDVVLWARRKAATGSLRLLEPNSAVA
jgi:uncharacterized protein YhaN